MHRTLIGIVLLLARRRHRLGGVIPEEREVALHRNAADVSARLESESRSDRECRRLAPGLAKIANFGAAARAPTARWSPDGSRSRTRKRPRKPLGSVTCGVTAMCRSL